MVFDFFSSHLFPVLSGALLYFIPFLAQLKYPTAGQCLVLLLISAPPTGQALTLPFIQV